MFIGHYAVALAAKRASPETSLGTLTAAALGLDLLWPALVLAGVEKVDVAPGITAVIPLDFVSYPYSHSLAAAVGWSVLAGGLYFRRRETLVAAVIVGGCVFSHWLLDFASHRADMPLGFSPDSMRVGLGLWRSVPGTLALEGTMFAAAGWAAYKGGVPGRRLLAFMAALTAVYMGAVFGPPPPSGTAVAASALGQWAFVGWAAWLDTGRSPRA